MTNKVEEIDKFIEKNPTLSANKVHKAIKSKKPLIRQRQFIYRIRQMYPVGNRIRPAEENDKIISLESYEIALEDKTYPNHNFHLACVNQSKKMDEKIFYVTDIDISEVNNYLPQFDHVHVVEKI